MLACRKVRVQCHGIAPWRWAAGGAGLWALIVLATMLLNRHAIDDRSVSWPHAGAARSAAGASAEHGRLQAELEAARTA